MRECMVTPGTHCSTCNPWDIWFLMIFSAKQAWDAHFKNFDLLVLWWIVMPLAMVGMEEAGCIMIGLTFCIPTFSLSCQKVMFANAAISRLPCLASPLSAFWIAAMWSISNRLPTPRCRSRGFGSSCRMEEWWHSRGMEAGSLRLRRWRSWIWWFKSQAFFGAGFSFFLQRIFHRNLWKYIEV